MEFHRNRDLYMRKHHARPSAASSRALGVLVLPRAGARRRRGPRPRPAPLSPHARQELAPGRGEGIREAAEEYNRAGANRSARIPRLGTPRPRPVRRSRGRRRRGAPAGRARPGAGARAAWGCWARPRLVLAVSISGTDKLDTLTSAVRRGRGGGGWRGARGTRRGGGPPARVGAPGRAGGRPAPAAIAFESGGGFPISVADDGQLGRLLPLYFVLAAAALALAWRVLRGASAGAARALPRVVAYPAAAFIAFACLSLAWADRLAPAAELLTYFTIPFALLLAVRRRGRRSPTGRRRALRAGGRRARRRVRGGGPLPGGHARAVLLRPQPGGVERQLRLLPRDLAVRRPQPLRPPRGAGDGDPAGGAGAAPGRPAAGHRAAGRDVGRPVLLLLAVEHGRPDGRDAGRGGRDRRPHRYGWWWPAAWPRCSWSRRGLRGLDRDPRRLAAPGDQRPHPARGGHRAGGAEDPLSGSASAARPRPAGDWPRRSAKPHRANFVSHTTPLTVAAELGRRRAGALRLAARGRRARDRRCWQARPGARAGARRVAARAVRARAVLQRVPRGPAHLAGAGRGRGPAHLGRRDDGCTAGRRGGERERTAPRLAAAAAPARARSR